MLKKISLKILFILILLFALNFIYSRWFYESDIQKHSEILNLVRDIPNDADIIYLGESSNTTSRGDDIDKRPISAFIGDYFQELNTFDITKGASHSGIYKVLLENIPNENRVKTIVVTLNLRSFNAQWIYSNLETSLQKSLVLIKPYPPLFNRFLLSFKGYDIKTEKEREKEFKRKWEKDKFSLPFEFEFEDVKEWDEYMWNNGIKNNDGTKNDELSALACHYIKSYAFQINTNKNPRIKDFDDIVELAKKRNWNLVFNLLAENTEKAEDLVGKDLIYMINENAEILTKYYEKKGVIVVNNLNCVEDEQFVDQNWTTEHYIEKGRKIIAKNVAEALKVWYSDYFKEIIYENKFQTNFFNDCDSGEIWGQRHTITTEMAHSGEKSSKTGDGNDFSITLEYPFKIIPDSLKNKIYVEFWLFQSSLNHDAKLIVQAYGQNFQNYLNGFEIKDLVKDINVWTKYSKSISIPDSIKQADVIKMYVYNSSKEKIYIDDFKIIVGD